jgi:nitroreductase
MDERIGLFEALYTNRAIRRFQPDPIPDSIISKVIEAATQAPNGSNQQRWRFMVIRDPDLRRWIGEVYRRAMDELVPAEQVAKDTDLSADESGRRCGAWPST